MTSTTSSKILLVDDDLSSRESTGLLLGSEGYTVVTAAGGSEALGRLHEGFSVIITDLVMPTVGGMEVLAAAREQAPHTPVIMMTGRGSEAAAVAALKAGAFYYLTKPGHPDELLGLVRQAAEKFHMAAEIAALHETLDERFGFANIIGKSQLMRKVFEQIKMVADTRSTVLIQGESGTGKELVARALHFNSARRRKPFVAINCAAIPSSLIESELFGYEKGAFTGAVSSRSGKFKAADGGTLLIDEIGEMHPDLQSKLLRVIESRGVTRLGQDREIPVDVRLVASSNRNLAKLVSKGDFREDLFYRLNVVNINLPPLRNRQEDIPLLVRAFIDEIAAENNRSAHDVTPEALALLKGYEWPGNVRQLRNVLESAIVMSSREVVDVVDLPEMVRGAQPVYSFTSVAKPGMTMAEIEKQAIVQALNRADGNRTRASKTLAISVRTLQRKINEYGLS